MTKQELLDVLNYTYCLKTYDFAGNDKSANVAHVENLSE